jgi:alpha-galactosidase
LGSTLLATASLHATQTVSLGTAIEVREADFEFARPVVDKSTAAQPLRIAGQSYASGVGTQTETTLFLSVNGATRFTALAGVDDAAATNDVAIFEIQSDGQTLWRSPELRKGQPAVAIDVDLRGKKELRLLTLDVAHALSQTHADWADAKFEFEGTAPKSFPFTTPPEAPYLLTPKSAPAPRLNSPRVFGARPGHPFLFTIAASGERPMKFAADGLPAGLTLDADTGRITGMVTMPGTHHVTLHATNRLGEATQQFRIEIGERISLTPALGWNSWNCWAVAVIRRRSFARLARWLPPAS